MLLHAFDEDGGDFWDDRVAVALGAKTFHSNGYPIAKQYTGVIASQGAPCSSKRVAKLGECRLRCARNAPDRLMSFPSRAAGVGTPIEALALVVRSNCISAQYRRRSGVAMPLKLQGEVVPPSPLNRARNLLSKDDWRASLADEGQQDRREMSLIALTLRAAMSD